MSYKYSKGETVQGDIKAKDDADRDTKIDFEEDYIGFETNGSATMVVSGSNVGIGAASPGANLHVSGDDARIRIDGDTDSHPGLELSEAGTRKWIIYNNYTTDDLKFKTDTADRMVMPASIKSALLGLTWTNACLSSPDAAARRAAHEACIDPIEEPLATCGRAPRGAPAAPHSAPLVDNRR